ncbi:hypothetical protein M8J77_022304 [Diaphorina citri]|nr:hypothetical protein M8J77_022304 [Diaphorina citri]
MKGLSLAITLWLTTVSSMPMSEYDAESLKPVISMIEKRERELEPLYVYEKEPEEEIIFVPEDYGQPEDIGYGYQKSTLSSELANFKEHYPYLTNQELEKLMLDYLEKGRPKDNYYIYGKTKKSVFRERDESEYPEKLQKLSPEREDDEEERYKEDVLYKNQSPFRERFREVEGKPNDRHVNSADLEYLSALNTLWEQYQHKQDYNDEENDDSNDVEPNDNVQLSDEDIAAILSYFEDKNDDDQRLEDSYDQINDNYPLVLLKSNKSPKHHTKSAQKRVWRDGAYEGYPSYGSSERLMIKKRALKTIPDLRKKKQPSPSITENKQRDINNQNGERELTQIFGDKKNSTKQKPQGDTKVTTVSTDTHSHAPVTTEKPIVVKKKSVDWSNYFGVDKRKKKSYKRSGNDNWPVEQYMRQNGINSVDTKDIDTKFRDMEDLILDQLIKYTGAHEGIRNPEQLHRIKQKIMTQLATAYSLEKMRHTLNDYKSAVDVHNMGESRYPVEKRIAIKKEMVQPKDSGVTLEEESNTIPELSKFPAHSKKSFFRRNNNSKYAAHGYPV